MVRPKSQGDSLQERIEIGDQIVHKIKYFLESFEKRFTLNNPRFVDRYIESEIHILLHFSIRGISEKFVALSPDREGTFYRLA